MNNVLINNWNNTVSEEDTVYFLGDLVPFEENLNKVDNRLKKTLKVK